MYLEPLPFPESAACLPLGMASTRLSPLLLKYHRLLTLNFGMSLPLKARIYTIVQRTYGSAPGGSWSLQENSAVYPVPVITSQGSAEWRIFPSEENSDAFTIQLVTTALGVDRYVGTNDANQVVVISIPVVAHPEQDIPQWKFLVRNS